ncbi:LptF/LptG family permease [Salaquimonas pukyongi]|uniref:LptF/LptG family permease n=1 Tax=Salaquimonas pukyongi TaxID=2712698 RepID=UPI00096BAAEA|nr:LptF/LptG family permease [Salaquimonas pukyongi]
MRLIERYIFRKAGIATLAILLSLAGVVWIVQALGKIDIITAKGQSLQSYFMATTLVIPMLFLAVIPVALLLGTVATVNTLNSNSELVVINASGASNRIVLKPFLVLALICSLFTGFVGHFVIAWSLTSLKTYKREMAADLVSILVKEGDFTQVEKGLTIHIAKRLPDGRLGGILISDDRTPEQQQTFLAREGALSRSDQEAILYLRDGEILQKNLSDNSSSVIRYDSYAFDLDTLSAKDKSFKQRPKERITPELLFPDPDDSYYKKQPELYTSEIHQRFSEMLWPFAYVMVILAFCGQARSSRQGYGSAIASGMILLLVLRGFAFSAASSIKANESMAMFLYIIPLGAIAYAGYYLYQNRQIGVPRRLQPVLERASLRSEAWLKAQNERYLAWRRKLAGVAS